METELRRQCEQALAAVRDLFGSGTIEAPAYYKCVVAMAYEYMAGDEPETSVSLLLEVPLSYYQEHQVQQMLEDDKYAACVRLLARNIVLRGYLDGTMPLPGTARA